jgi:hypothetical protein
MRTIKGRTAVDQPEAYAYEDRWRPLDVALDTPLSDNPVPRAKGAKVTITVR